ncbi:hypothetical protein ACUNV4_03530 [Granulosicoccus sp. 3-233]|uniref:hypothetical protein n=1 Tax=Granulosicoccus sp. 3-233 TaxID=3417969 RepID=UPI003D3531A8
MAAIAFSLGRWAENLNPDGIIPHTPVVQDAASGDTTAMDTTGGTASSTASEAGSDTSAESVTPRNAFTFGASMGLLAAGLLYCVIAAGLLLRQRARGLPANRFIIAVAGLAVTGFALSYLIDDYFY